MDSARPRLEHFCATLSGEFNHPHPDYHLDEQVIDGETYLSATVTLPAALSPYRFFDGIAIWKTEKMAMKDVSFQACKELHKVGWLNDNLLPAHRLGSEKIEIPDIVKLENLIKVGSIYDPWIDVANAWKSAQGSFYQTTVDLGSTASNILPKIKLILPVPLPSDVNVTIYWNEDTTFDFTLRKGEAVTLASNFMEQAVEITYLLLESIFPQRMTEKRLDFGSLFIPDLDDLSFASVSNWLSGSIGSVPAMDAAEYPAEELQNFGLVRSIHQQDFRAWVPEEYVWVKEPVHVNRVTENGTEESFKEIQDVLHVKGLKWPKRADYLHPIEDKKRNSNDTAGDNGEDGHENNSDSDGDDGDELPVNKPMHHTAQMSYAAHKSMIRKLPLKYSRFALFIPSITHRIETYLVAEKLRNTILSSVGFDDLDLVVTAISASAAQETTNYQRFEFLGDTVLKLETASQLMVNNPLAHEGLLSSMKDVTVSNSNLCKACCAVGLDGYILTVPFTGSKWRPLYMEECLKRQYTDSSTPLISMKTLADVVESLIGAAFIDGGIDKAAKCIQIFLSDKHWTSFGERVHILYDRVRETDNEAVGASLDLVEKMIGYQFKKRRLLIEALSHPSNVGDLTYQRLEFLGDAILDFLVVRRQFENRQFSHEAMHLMKSACTNADFLAYLCLDIHTEEERTELVEAPTKPLHEDTPLPTMQTTTTIYLFQAMAHFFQDIPAAQCETLERHAALKPTISRALAGEPLNTEADGNIDLGAVPDAAANTGPAYPWLALARLRAPKFFSDLIESILGAIYIDSHGDWHACQAFLCRIRLIDHLDRFIAAGVNFKHPKTLLAEATGGHKVEYVREVNEYGQITCSVVIDGVELVTVRNQLSRGEAESKAAGMALAALADMREEQEEKEREKEREKENHNEMERTKTEDPGNNDAMMDEDMNRSAEES